MKNTSHLSNLNPDVVAAWEKQIAAARERPICCPKLHVAGRIAPPLRGVLHVLEALYLAECGGRCNGSGGCRWPASRSCWLWDRVRTRGHHSGQDSCTLINAITAANTDSATGGCPAGSGADTIVPPAAASNTDQLSTTAPMVPRGCRSSAVRSRLRDREARSGGTFGAPEFRIIAVNSTGELTLNETTISGGQLLRR